MDVNANDDVRANGGTDKDIDRVVEIERLAALDGIDYEAVRTSAAAKLGVRASVLDKEVKKKRRVLGLDKADDEPGQGRAVKIEEVLPWPDPVDGDTLVTMLVCGVKTHIVVRDEAADAMAFWILHTWLVNEFTISPRLAITSPTKGCGKTTVLNLLNLITRRPKRAGSISPPALFRAVEEYQPTLLLDENEKYLESGSDFHALLNEGHSKGATVIRVLGEKQELREFSVFGAVAFARNGKIPDDLEQRSIVVELHRRKADEPVTELRPERRESLIRVARMAARWCNDHSADIARAEPDMAGMINRVADNWRPLFAIADVIGGEWRERIRAAAVVLTPREPDSIGPMLLADIKAVFSEKGTDRLASGDLCEALEAMEGRPWAEWKDKKPLTKNQLARLLGDFQVTPVNMRIGAKVPKGYYLHQFEGAWQRYLAPQGVNEPLHRYNADEIRTSATFQNATPDSSVADQKCEKPPSNGHCSGVAVQKGGGHEGRHGDTVRTCAQCGASDGQLVRRTVGKDQVWLHRECHPFYVEAQHWRGRA